MWNGSVLWTMLDILQLLSRSVVVDNKQEADVYPVPNTNYRLTVMDTNESREVCVERGCMCYVSYWLMASHCM